MKVYTLFLIASTFPLLTMGQSAAHVPGQVIVQLNAGADFLTVQREVNARWSPICDFELVKTVSRRMNIHLATFDTAVIGEREMVRRLNTLPLVRAAQLNHKVQQRDTVPDDPQLSQMWALNGSPGVDIGAAQAWGITTGGLTLDGDTVVVADVDGGFDLLHEDLNFWKNHQEVPFNGVDDDGNGYVDDYDGWNAYDSDGNITSSYHGTHTAGTIAAKGNNGIGVTGIGWNTQVMPIMGSTGNEATVLEAYGYALEMRAMYNQSIGQGAFVVATNSSFGVDFGQTSDFPLWCSMYDSLGAYGILNAGATANLNIDVDSVGDIPTACSSDFLITVTNTTSTDVRYSSAGFGLTTIDLGAPGTNTRSTTPGNSYGTSTGTSMATPHVAGAIGLVYGLPCQAFIDSAKLNPAGTALMVKSFILAGVDTLPDLADKTVTGGRLNLYRTLKLALEYYGCDSNTVITNADDVANPFTTFSIYPNPMRGSLTLEWLTLANTTATLTVTNMYGQTVLAKPISTSSSFYQVEVNMGHLAHGIYILSLNDATGKPLYKTKIIKHD